MIYGSLEHALGLRPGTQGGVSHGLALASFGVTGTLLCLSLTSLPTPRGHVALLKAGLFFAPCGERHVHRNHVVGAVRLVGVYG